MEGNEKKINKPIKFIIIIDLISLGKPRKGNWLYVILDDEINSELDSSSISLKFVGRER